MYRKNDAHLQIDMLSIIDALPEKQQRRLDASWAGTFYREFFCRIDESRFAVLYSENASRPNIPVNVLVSLEYLKAGKGWSDEDMYDAFLFDVQVRYALGYRKLGEGAFELRTVYNFRNRLSEHMQETGENLLDETFAAVTDAQIAAFGLKTDKLRMDSGQILSNIRVMSRLQLLVEVVQRVHRLLNEEGQARYAADFAPYMKGKSGQYVYGIPYGETAPHIERLGILMDKLLDELATEYGETPVYKTLHRVFHEHFVYEGDALRSKQGHELRACSLQAPDDPEATYRKKAGQSYKGYVVNATETCNPSNPFQLVVDVQTESNTTDDSVLLTTALPELVERTEVSEIYTDGGYNSPDVDIALAKHEIIQVQSAIRGGQPSDMRLHLADFTIQTTEDGTPSKLTCPAGQTVDVEAEQKPGRFSVHFDTQRCASCPLLGSICPAQPGKRDPRPVLRFTQEAVAVARRRQRCYEARANGQNLRSAVESTIRSLKLPFSDDQLPVRGRFRVRCMMIGSAVLTNVRRINRYLNTRTQPGSENGGTNRTRKATTNLRRTFTEFLGLFAWLRRPWACYYEEPSTSPSGALQSLLSLLRSLPHHARRLSGALGAGG